MKEIAVFLSASETHNKKNVNKTIAATLEAFRETVPPGAGARACGCAPTSRRCTAARTRAPSIRRKAVELCRALRALGCYQISLGDTIGVANPRQVRDVLTRVLAEIPRPRWRCTSTTRAARRWPTSWSSVELGITTVDAALGGLGGCPYAPGASGNVATEDVVYMLEGMGVRTGVDLDKLIDCSRLASSLVGHELPVEVLPGGHRARRQRVGAAAPGRP